MATVLSVLRDMPAYKLTDLFPNMTQAMADKLLYVCMPQVDNAPQSNTPVFAVYGSTTAITTAWYKDFAKGSFILDAFGATPAIYLKTSASGTDTWKYQAINT